MLDDNIIIKPHQKHQLVAIENLDQSHLDDPKIVQVVDWVHEYLAKPHKDLGRSGAVCPFVPFSLKSNSIYLAKIEQELLDTCSMSKIIKEFGDLFVQKSGSNQNRNLNNAFIVVFTSLGRDQTHLVDEVQNALKPYFVEQGLMLGEFHSKNEGSGLRNPNFKPLRSPVPLLAIRHMVDSDLPFMMSPKYLIEERILFLRSYLRNLKGELNDVQFTKSLDMLISLEIELDASMSTKFAEVMESQTCKHAMGLCASKKEY